MNFSKLTSLLKLILLKLVEEIERRINEKNGVDGKDGFTSSLYTSLKFIVLDQVDDIVDQTVAYTKKQIDDLANIIVSKTSIILSSLVYILIFVGIIFLTYMFFAISLALFLGDMFSSNYIGFLIVGGINVLILIMLHFWGKKAIAGSIQKQLSKIVSNKSLPE
ncbi:MAG: phage holin family protein [Saprospiraceae bacterium]|nr:phage holin family protein [Saprospiraceae bacterium]